MELNLDTRADSEAIQGRIHIDNRDSLGRIIDSNPRTQHEFELIQRLWKSLFGKDRARFPIPHYEEEALEPPLTDFLEKVEELIFGGEFDKSLPLQSFVPTPREALLLCSFCWFYPLGLVWGLFEEELDAEQLPRRGQDLAKRRLALNSHSRAARFFEERWVDDTSWDEEERKKLAELFRCFAGDSSLDELPRATDVTSPNRDPSSVDLATLVGLIRIANALRTQKGYCSQEVAKIIKQGTNNDKSDGRTAITDSLVNITVDHKIAKMDIAIQDVSPQNLDDPEHPRAAPIRLDIRPAASYFCQRLNRHLCGELKFLAQYPNIRVGKFELAFSPKSMVGTKNPSTVDSGESHRTRQSHASSGQNVDLIKLVYRGWHLHLAATTCATESACLFGLVVEETLEADSDTSLKDRLENKIKVMQKMQPFNVLGRSIIGIIRKHTGGLNDANEAERKHVLRQELRTYLRNRIRACEDTSAHATETLRGYDMLIVYGFSRNVLNAVERSGFNGKLLVVQVDAQIRLEEAKYTHLSNLTNEDYRLKLWKDSSHLTDEHIEHVVLAGLHRRLRQNDDKKLAFLVGARGCLRDLKAVD